MAVKLKLQSPNWQMQRNALLVCFEMVIVWLIGLSKPCGGKLSSCKCRTLYWLFGTFLLFAGGTFSPSSSEPSSSNSSFLLLLWPDRTLVSADALGHFLRSNPNWKKKTHADNWNAAQTDSQNAYNISSAPLLAQVVSKGEAQSGKAPWRRLWFMVIDLYRAS